jgi:hypothetical protein
MLLSRTGEEKRNTRRYGAAACKEDGLCGRNFTQERVRRRLRASTVVAGMLALAAAHCMAGFITYGVKDWSSVSVKLLQVGSLQLSTASPELVQEAVKQSWENEVEPSQRALEQQGEAILSEMRALKHVASQVVAVQGVESKYGHAPSKHETLTKLLRPPPSGQQPTILLQVCSLLLNLCMPWHWRTCIHAET